jgi:AcrR family transcriptional regulator
MMRSTSQAATGTHRKTRLESRQETRARLLVAAWEVFSERGFGAASVEEVAARAGFTRGAFYSNFADKEEIFLALMDDRLASRIAGVAAVMRSSSPGALFADLRAWNAGIDEDPAWLPLMAEFRAHALRSESARERLAERERTLRRLYAEGIQAQFDQVGVTPPAPVEQLALVVQALDHWLPVQGALDGDAAPDDTLFDILALLFRAVVALADAPRGGSPGSRTARRRRR